jgi:hypothetical protein
VGSKALNFAIKFVGQATKMPLTMGKLKPFVEKLLYEVIVVPIMLVTHRDITLFREDAIEYVRKQNDFSESLFAPKNSAVDLLTYFCNYKAKKKQPVYLKGFLTFCARNLIDYARGVVAADGWRIKEAILFAIGTQLEDVSAYKELQAMVEPMLGEHVLPELSNAQQPFLRMRGLWIYGEFTRTMKFKDESHLSQVVE